MLDGKITISENNDDVIIDLGCGEGGNPDIGLDACKVKEDNDFGGKPAQLTLVYNPDADGVNTQGDKAKIIGANDDDDSAYLVITDKKGDTIYFEGEVTKGQAITFSAPGSKGLGSQTFINVYDSAADRGGSPQQVINLHTSCSAPLVIGESFGSVELAGFGFMDDGAMVEFGQTATDGDDGVVYEITGGADAALFTVDADTGEVSFIDPPDYENPQDAGGDNNYDVEVTAFYVDGNGVKTGEICEVKPLEICVEDDCIKVTENTTVPVIDLDCGEGGNPDIGLDACKVKEDNDFGGKPAQLTLVYNPDADGVNTQGDKAKIIGANDDDDSAYLVITDKKGDTIYFEGEVTKGQAITFSAPGSKGLGSQTFINVYDSAADRDGSPQQVINLHTSCSAPLVIGESFGSVELAGFGFMDDGAMVEFGQTATDGDDGVVYEITGGADAALFTVDADTGEVSFIDPPDYENPQDAGGDNNYDVEITAFYVDGNGVKTGEICEVKPLEICVEDDPTDDPVCIDENTKPVVDLNLTLDCPREAPKDVGLEVCAERDRLKDDADIKLDKPTELTLTLGDALSTQPSSVQPSGKSDVSAIFAPEDGDGQLFVRVTDDDDPSKTDTVYFQGAVNFGESFTALASNAGDTKFASNSYVHIFDDDGTLLQTIKYHTSCSAPILIGDAVGSVTVTAVGLPNKDTGAVMTFGGTETTIETLGEGDIVYSIVGGTDGDLFVVDPETGEVSFKNAPDYESPLDQGMNNIYDVTIRVTAKSDPTCFKDTPIAVCVEDVPEGGSLSGTYFCDDDRDGVDDGAAAGDVDIAGKLVTLLNADGTPASDIDGNPVAPVLTDATGDYRFVNLAPGSYVVMFEPTDGKSFIAPDVGSDDTIDSDVIDPVNGKTAPVTVVVGEETKDVDAGVEKLAGSLSGTYFCDDDRDGVDDGAAAGDVDIAGKLVTLLNADGTPASDIDGNPVAPVLTDATGDYRFVNLAPGSYVVMFEPTDGKNFIAPDVGSDDTIDSDVIDPVNGKTAPVTVVAGEETKDVDAGVEKLNGNPEPHDDAGKGCADTLIRIDVLANDTDPDADPLTVQAVNGVAISEGLTIDIGGVLVTLDGGDLVFDGETPFAGLDIGEEASVTYSYTVSDGNGGTANADVDVTFCGDANSIVSLCESLPDGQITYRVQASNLEFPVEEYAFDLQIVDAGDVRLDGVIFQQAYCLDRNTPFESAEILANAPLVTAEIYCSEEATAGNAFRAEQTSFFNGQSAANNLDLINWILNQDFENNGYSGWEVQRAVWELTNNEDLEFLDAIDPGFGDDDNVDAILALAAGSGEGFKAGVGDVVGIIVDPGDDNPLNTQPFILAVNFEAVDCFCF
ncbi:SdrD B-like domain-containing protein [Oceaniovalibus sp. ACAM 378]|uniref:DUF7467 domain-containing protein n=1 Tax=Oceaniovalibus sp. ACAM 378 TaxID=2599923 RepID=UPI0011D5BEF2|nr:SdrD B-like domain-containing protein [Oceaniovalibus sp. ACAM 378]TYB83686.1 hypothetical protein FQ320_24340 [Oceaniovalibus sp. ACAM 378]